MSYTILLPSSRRSAVRPSGRRRGFSMVELLTVLTIIGITTAIAFPKLRAAGQDADVRAAESALVASVSRTRAAAIQRGQPARLYFGGNQAWTAVVAANGDTTHVGSPTNLAGLFQVTAVVTPAENDYVQFDARGVGVPAAGAQGSAVRVDLTRSAGHAGRFCVTRYGRVLRGAVLAACGG